MPVRFVLDPIDFVRNAGIHQDKIPVSMLTRLHDLLFDNEGNLKYKISGYFNKNNQPSLHLEIKGKIHLCCQRCLDKLPYIVELKTVLLLVKDETELDKADEGDTIDAILATPNLDIWNLIEEEIILSLSISSRHPSGECKIYRSGSNEDILFDKPESVNAFAALAPLKNKN